MSQQTTNTPSGAVVAQTEIPQVIACIPLYEMVYGAFLQTFLQSLRGSAGVLMLKATYIQDGFNQMVWQALQQHPDAKWVFFLEQDMVLPEGIVGALAEDYEQREPGIYGGLYFGRTVEDQRPIPGRFDENAHALTRLEAADLDPMMQSPGPYPMDVVGCGCTFVHRDVFEKWDRNHPGFSGPAHSSHYCAGHMLDNAEQQTFPGPWFCTPPGPDAISVMSQDTWFCWHARAQGFPVYLDTRLQAEHKGLASFTYASHLGWRRQMQLAQQAQSAPVLSPALLKAHGKGKRPARRSRTRK